MGEALAQGVARVSSIGDMMRSMCESKHVSIRNVLVDMAVINSNWNRDL